MKPQIRKLREKLALINCDAILISNFYNILYLSGFKTLTETEREAWFLITKKNSYLFTDERYLEKNKNSTLKTQKEMVLKLISPEKNLICHLKEIIEKERIINLGFEADDLKYSEYQRLSGISIKLIPTEKLIVNLRSIKELEEIKKIKKACQIADQCLTEIIKTIKIGQTEREIAFKIEFWLKNQGFDSAFYPIVAIDENSAVPHYNTKTNGQKKVQKDSIILIDFGAKYQDYCSDITRVIFAGKPKTYVLNIYQYLLTAQTKTINFLISKYKENDNPVLGKEIDQFCRQLLKNYFSSMSLFTTAVVKSDIYPHSTGHGIGLEVHEYPKIASNSTGHIEKNQVFTIEPGIYLSGRFGIRIEDTVWLKEKHQPQILTSFPKQVIVLS